MDRARISLEISLAISPPISNAGILPTGEASQGTSPEEEAVKNADKLKKSMRPGRVYRRQHLEGFSTAVDRDLGSLAASGEVKKLAAGLYYRPRKNRFGDTPPVTGGSCVLFSKHPTSC